MSTEQSIEQIKQDCVLRHQATIEPRGTYRGRQIVKSFSWITHTTHWHSFTSDGETKSAKSVRALRNDLAVADGAGRIYY